MVIGFGGVILGILGMIYDYIQDKSISKLQTSQLQIPKSKLIHLTNEWCHENLNTNKLQKPKVQIKYTKNKNYEGIYYPTLNTMVIHVKTNMVIDLITNTIHEYQHHQQNRNGFLLEYNKELDKVGYWYNKYEIECRTISNKFKYRCLREILSNTNLM
jgi:hypothetical protein